MYPPSTYQLIDHPGTTTSKSTGTSSLQESVSHTPWSLVWKTLPSEKGHGTLNEEEIKNKIKKENVIAMKQNEQDREGEKKEDRTAIR